MELDKIMAQELPAEMDHQTLATENALTATRWATFLDSVLTSKAEEIEEVVGAVEASEVAEMADLLGNVDL